jgi:hypothetical protein
VSAGRLIPETSPSAVVVNFPGYVSRAVAEPEYSSGVRFLLVKLPSHTTNIGLLADRRVEFADGNY